MKAGGPLHLAIDLRIVDALGMEMTGVGRYTLEATRALQRVRPDWRFSLFSNRPELLLQTSGTTVVGSRLPTDRAVGRILWLHTAGALTALRVKADVWFGPSFVLPLWWPGQSVVTIHDLTFLLLRTRYRGRLHSSYATAATRWSARHADRVLCPSHATRGLVISHLGIEAAKVEVTPEGVADSFFSASALDPSQDTARGACPYLLFVGTWEARKGIATLYAALRRLNDGGKRVKLVLAGQPGWGTEDLLEQMRRDRSVEFLHRPSDEQLAALYRGALALVYPSEMEGFGLPVAEAMACGCSIIATDLPSIREFAGGNPFYIRPGDSEQLARHVERLLDGGLEAQERRERGREAVAALRWSALGERTASLIEQLQATRQPARRHGRRQRLR
jgi:glycosyltransferase involved in cell wall biosynthesis